MDYLDNTCSLSGVILDGGDGYPSVQITRNVGYYGALNDLWDTLPNLCVSGFKFYDDVAVIPNYNNPSSPIKIEKGNLEERLIDVIKKIFPLEDNPEQFLQDELIPALRQSFKEITKEEYESMITYKPE